MTPLSDKYVTKRSRSGGTQWYWQRPGHKLQRLPDNPAERSAMAERLNRSVEAVIAPAPVTILDLLGHEISPEPNTGCWIWTGASTEKGYGLVTIAGRSFQTHRLGYELAKGKIPDALQIDHLCRMPSCVNPEHMEAVTAAENQKRARPYRRRTRNANAEPTNLNVLG